MLEIKNIQHDKFPNIRYRVLGTGPVLVLIHGFPETGDLWQEVWTKLSENQTLIIPDLPGSGGSSRCTEPLTMELLAECVKLILDAEGMKKAVIAGHSMGGYAALAFAEMYPETIKGLVMVHSMAYADSEEKKEQRRKSIALIEKGGKDTFIRQMIPNLFSETYKKQYSEVLKNRIEKALEQKTEALSDFYNAMIKRPDRTDLLTGAAFPIQWIVGKEDTIASPDKVLQQSILSNVNFVSVYTDCSHMGMVEQPVKLTNDMAMFCEYCYRN